MNTKPYAIFLDFPFSTVKVKSNSQSLGSAILQADMLTVNTGVYTSVWLNGKLQYSNNPSIAID